MSSASVCAHYGTTIHLARFQDMVGHDVSFSATREQGHGVGVPFADDTRIPFPVFTELFGIDIVPFL